MARRTKLTERLLETHVGMRDALLKKFYNEEITEQECVIGLDSINAMMETALHAANDYQGFRYHDHLGRLLSTVSTNEGKLPPVIDSSHHYF